MVLGENEVFVAIEEIGEVEALISMNNLTIPVPINSETKGMLEEIFSIDSPVLPYNISENAFFQTVDARTLRIYPELQNDEIKGAADPLPSSNEMR